MTDPIARLRELAEKKNRCAREGPESLREGCESEAALLNDAADALAKLQQERDELLAEQEKYDVMRQAYMDHMKKREDTLRQDLQHVLDTCVPVAELKEVEARVDCLTAALEQIRIAAETSGKTYQMGSLWRQIRRMADAALAPADPEPQG